MRKRYTDNQKAALVGLVRTGVTVVQAAGRVGVAPSTAYNWAARARGEQQRRGVTTATPTAAPLFARVVPSGEEAASIVVKVGGAEIVVRRNFAADLLRAVVETLGGGA